MKLPKKIRFWLFRIKAHNLNQKIEELSLVSAFWFSIMIAIIIWAVFHTVNGRPAVINLPEPNSSANSTTNKEATPSIQVLLYTDENLIKDLPKQINTETDLNNLIKASQSMDLNIDIDLNQLDY